MDARTNAAGAFGKQGPSCSDERGDVQNANAQIQEEGWTGRVRRAARQARKQPRAKRQTMHLHRTGSAPGPHFAMSMLVRDSRRWPSREPQVFGASIISSEATPGHEVVN